MTDESSGTEPNDTQVPTGVALFGLPEYDAAFVDFVLKVRDGLIAAMYPPLGKVQRVKTRTLFRGQNSIGAGEPLVHPVIATKTPIGLSQTSVHNTDIESLTSELVTFAERYGQSLVQQVVASINSVTTATGNVVNAEGPLTIDTYLDALETVDLAFDPQGEPSIPSIVTQDLQEVELSALGEFTPEQEMRKAQIIARKREDHIARRRSRRIPKNPLGT